MLKKKKKVCACVCSNQDLNNNALVLSTINIVTENSTGSELKEEAFGNEVSNAVSNFS